MKIAFFTYPAAFQNVGGGEILLLKVREYLQKEGAEVDLFDTWKGHIQDYQVLQVFGSVKDCLGLVRVAKSRGVKVAVTPLLWSDPWYALHSAGSVKTKVELLARHTMKVLFPAFPSARRELLRLADVVFPNSEIEKEQNARLFALPKEKLKVIHNGVDEEFSHAVAAPFQAKYGPEPFVLGVGRIEPRKNQLNLIHAVKKAGGIRLILIGSPVSGYESYFAECEKEGKSFTTFIPTLSHSDPMLRSAYAACSLFVLQGWFETPGLVAMEAGLAGARVIATRGGSTREYFKREVDYFDPANPADIAKKIRINLSKPKYESFARLIRENYTWDRIAKAYLAAYRGML